MFSGLPSRWYSLVAIVFVLAINLGLMRYSGAEPVEAVATGILGALAASGSYSQVRAAVHSPTS